MTRTLITYSLQRTSCYLGDTLYFTSSPLSDLTINPLVYLINSMLQCLSWISLFSCLTEVPTDFFNRIFLPFSLNTLSMPVFPSKLPFTVKPLIFSSDFFFSLSHLCLAQFLTYFHSSSNLGFLLLSVPFVTILFSKIRLISYINNNQSSITKQGPHLLTSVT